ncbi:MAG TPA: S-layer homology domain-containing protein [Clostridiales bacterium]|nr:S-layer homology domain-containing protein [Clostridiales bacterium]
MKKLICFITAIIFAANLVFPTFAYAAEDTGIRVHNGIVEYRVNSENGRFTIHTADGLPNKASDNDKNLLFFWDKPNTSFTTFRIDGKDYIFGNSYGLLGAEGGIVSPPKVDGNITTTVWRIKDIEVTQKLQLIVDMSNPNVGNTKITYQILNKGTSNVQLGSRILLDTQLGTNDASSMLVGANYVTNETEYIGKGIPAAWKSADEKFAPGVISYGLLSGWDNIAPDRMVIAHWESLSNTKWGYAPNELINFTSNKNKYGSADSAVALYFEPKTLNNGAEVVYETFYGIGSLSDTYNDAKFNFQINTPNKLTVNKEGTGYNEENFNVVVTIDNSSASAEPITNATVILGLSEELSFVDDQPDRQYIKNIAAGETLAVEFKVSAKVQQSLKVAELGATVQYNNQYNNNESYAEGRKFIVLPSVKGKPPAMQMTEISPKIAYTKSQKKTFVIKGSDFDALKADYEWTMYIKGQNSGISYQIMRKDINITNDTLTVAINKDYEFKADKYNIVLYSSAYGNMSKTIELSNNKKYDRKEYGTLLMGAFKEDKYGKPVYDVMVLEKEEEFEKLDDSIKDNILLTLRGEIYEYEINGQIQYDCGSGTIINRSILYTAPTAEPNKCLTVKRYNKGGVDWWGRIEDSLVLTGDGFLTIGDYTFHYGDFYVVLKDGEEYELADPTDAEGDSDYNWDNPMEDEKSNVEIITPTNVVAGEILKTVGLFTGTKITINNAVIGTNTVSLGGSISVELPWWSSASDDGDDDEGDDEGKSDLEKKFDKNDGLNSAVGEAKKNDDLLSLSLDEMRYGVTNNNSSYLVGLIANGSLQLDDDTIPKFKAGGAHAAFALDSLNYDGMYAAINAGFKVGDAFECDGTVALVFETGGSCIPDSVELVLGGDALKIPLGAGPANVGYLTKIGGGVYNLYNTIKGYYNVIPPLTLKLISGYADPTLYSFRLDTIGLEFGLNGFQLTAEEGKIVGIKMIDSAYAKFLVYVTEYNGVKYPCVDIGAGIKMNILGIIRGEGSIWLVADPRIDSIFGHVSLGGKAYVGLFIPDYIPLLGGMELAAIMAELSTYRAYLGIRIIGIPFSVGYYWADKKVKFNDDFALLAQELNVPMEELENALGYEYVGTDSNSDGLLVFGGNLRQTYSSKRSNDAKLLAYDTKHEIPVNSQDYALFELQYTGDMPSITVTKPDGSNYVLKENENYRVQTIAAENTDSGITEQMVYISVTDPEDGIWTITTDKAVDCTAMNVLALPELESVSCQQVSNQQLKVGWDALNVDDSYTVDINLSEIQKTVDLEDFSGNEEEYNREMAQGYDPGIIVAKDIPVNDKQALVDITERLTSGSYQARVVLKKGNEVYASELSQETFTYVNPNVPDMPENIQVSPGGDGQFKVTYDAVENAQGYVVTILDESGNELEGFEGIITDKTKVYIGNKSTVAEGYDEKGNPTGFKEAGVATGKSYRVKVYSYNEKDYITYKSQEYVSDVIYLPQPNPAKVTLKLNDTLATEADNKNKNTVGATTNNKNSVVKYIPDQNVEVAYWVDGVTNDQIYEVDANAPLEIPVTLDEGGSVVEFLAVNGANDYTSSKLIATLDTVNPELLLDSVSVLSTNGRYEIVGTSEPNANVYVHIGDNLNAAPAPIPMFAPTSVSASVPIPVPVINGSFSYIGRQTGTRDEIKVTAIDAAGNETVMYVEIIPSEISSFKSISIKNDEYKEVENIEIFQGDTAQIKVYGVSENGEEFQLDNRNIAYSVVYGCDKASINEEGVIEGNYYGEAVVLCEYYVTDNYSFEQTVNVTVSQAFEEAKDIRISTTDVSASQVGSLVARFSIPDAPVGVTYSYTMVDNDYFELAGNQLILKKEMDASAVTILVTAQGKHVLDGIYENIGNPITKEFTLKLVKNIESAEIFDSITVYEGTPFKSLRLPEKAKVKLNTGELIYYPITWNRGAYNADIVKTYNLKGTIQRDKNVNNPDDIYAQISVTVREYPPEEETITDTLKKDKTTPKDDITIPEEDITYKYEDGTMVINVKKGINTIKLGETILGMKTDKLKINFENIEFVLDNDTVDALRNIIDKSTNTNNAYVSISAKLEGNSISINVENLENVKGIVRAKLPDQGEASESGKMSEQGEISKHGDAPKLEGAFKPEDINEYNMVILKDGKVVPNSYYDKTTGRIVFKMDGNGDYTAEQRSFRFDDTKDNWAKDIISYAAVRGLVNGVGNNNFAPNNNLTRAEFLKMILGAAGIIPETTVTVNTKLASDVKATDWYAPYVSYAMEKGIVSGPGDGSFRPNNYITRQEMMVILNNCMKYLGFDLKTKGAGELNFKDKSNVSDWAIAAVQNVTSLGLVVGTDDGRLLPLNNATRAEGAAVMMRCIKLMANHIEDCIQ